jgi:membrane protein YqaA with SNARE-associated domain
VLKRIETLALGLGGPGLFLLALLDSSFLALPEVVDILIVWMVIEHPDRWLWYGVMATAGSVAGSYVLYALARRGGEAFLRRRLRDHHITRGMHLFRRYGVLALVVPSLMPPPVPFKPFVLMAGVSSMRATTFLAAVTAGRSLRYIGEALLALLYGRQALAYVHQHAATLLQAGTALLIAGAAGYYAYRKLRAKR